MPRDSRSELEAADPYEAVGSSRSSNPGAPHRVPQNPYKSWTEMGKSSPTEVCCSGSTWRPLALAVVSGLNVAPRRRRVHGSAQPHFL
ncbi:unnamed protein product, partial [Symbiodinium microadriaticum]